MFLLSLNDDTMMILRRDIFQAIADSTRRAILAFGIADYNGPVLLQSILMGLGQPYPSIFKY
jgi:hypothetical protein